MVDYDVIIIGSGPAGMNACLYASRANLKTLVIEKNCPGGKVIKAKKIENWIGTESIEGSELALNMFKHAFSNGGVYEQNNVLDIIDYGVQKEVVLMDKKYKCYAVIVCVGTSERKIGIPGEEKFYGRGVSYCAICDASLYKDKVITVVGNSEDAMKEAIYLANYAKKVIIINNKEKLDARESLLKEMRESNKIQILNKCNIISINGSNFVETVTIENEKKETIHIETSAVFPLVGSSPDTMFSRRIGISNKNNYIEVNNKQETNIKGIYAAGDCTNKSLKQIVTASGDGAIAAIEAYKYINEIKKESI